MRAGGQPIQLRRESVGIAAAVNSLCGGGAGKERPRRSIAGQIHRALRIDREGIRLIETHAADARGPQQSGACWIELRHPRTAVATAANGIGGPGEVSRLGTARDEYVAGAVERDGSRGLARTAAEERGPHARADGRKFRHEGVACGVGRTRGRGASGVLASGRSRRSPESRMTASRPRRRRCRPYRPRFPRRHPAQCLPRYVEKIRFAPAASSLATKASPYAAKVARDAAAELALCRTRGDREIAGRGVARHVRLARGVDRDRAAGVLEAAAQVGGIENPRAVGGELHGERVGTATVGALRRSGEIDRAGGVERDRGRIRRDRARRNPSLKPEASVVSRATNPVGFDCFTAPAVAAGNARRNDAARYHDRPDASSASALTVRARERRASQSHSRRPGPGAATKPRSPPEGIGRAAEVDVAGGVDSDGASGLRARAAGEGGPGQHRIDGQRQRPVVRAEREGDLAGAQAVGRLDIRRPEAVSCQASGRRWRSGPTTRSPPVQRLLSSQGSACEWRADRRRARARSRTPSRRASRES